MTDDNELRRMLGDLADETPEVSAQEWLTGTRHKVRVRRRLRWAGAGVAVALVLAAAVAVVPQVVDDAAPDPDPVEPVPSGPREWQIGEGIEPRRLIASRLNDRGASELEWTKTVRRADLGTVADLRFCQLPEGAAAAGSKVRAVSVVQGTRDSTACRHWDEYPEVGRRMVTWGYLGASSAVAGGEPSPRLDQTYRVSMWLERDGRRVDIPGAEFGYAFYWACHPAPRLVEAPGTDCDETFRASEDELPRPRAAR